MPQRLLRPGLTTSRRFNALDWQAQSFFVRLLTLVDDYGRCEADPALLASLCFPLHRDIICQQVADICQQLSAQGMAIFYEVGGTPYLQLTRWKERARSECRYPAPPDNICQQLPSTVVNCQQMIASPPQPQPQPQPQPAAADAGSIPDRGGDQSLLTSAPTAGEGVPTREEVVAFAASWAGDLARGIPPGIPEGWALSWCNWRMGENAPVFPREWKRDLVNRFVADWVKKKPDTRHAPDSQSPIANRQVEGRAERIAALEAALKTEKDPVEREKLRAQLKAMESAARK